MFKSIVGLGFSKWWKFKKDIAKIISNHIKNNAWEFFCGYNPIYWAEKFGYEVSPNGRFAEHEQITDIESLKEIVKEVHKYDKEIMWNINAWYYTDITAPFIERCIEDYMEAGVDGFICGSMWILEYFDEIAESKWEKWYIINGKKFKINISTILAVYNNEAIEFLLENYPINKIILSREVTLEEIKEITSRFPNLTFEVFGEWDFCRYNNGLCFAEHKYTNRDICTVVVNDLIIKQASKADYRKIIRNTEEENNTKVAKFENEYKDEFELLEEIMDEVWIEAKKDEVKTLIAKILNKYTLYYDPLLWPNTQWNKNVKLVSKILNKLQEKEFEEMRLYLEKDIKVGIQAYQNYLKELVWWKYGIEAKYKDNFYNRADNLNLYSYVLFANIPNVDTVKFPTRGRNYQTKLNLIQEIVESKWDNIIEYLDMSCVPSRAHYDLSFLFDGNKERFYDIRRKLINK